MHPSIMYIGEKREYALEFVVAEIHGISVVSRAKYVN